MIDKFLDWLNHKLQTECWFFWHDWEITDEAPHISPSSEQWYWVVIRCRKCGETKQMLNPMYDN